MEGRMERRIEVAEKQRRRRKQLSDDLWEKRVKRKHPNALSGELALEEAMDRS
jgi:hypothetical protein